MYKILSNPNYTSFDVISVLAIPASLACCFFSFSIFELQKDIQTHYLILLLRKKAQLM